MGDLSGLASKAETLVPNGGKRLADRVALRIVKVHVLLGSTVLDIEGLQDERSTRGVSVWSTGRLKRDPLDTLGLAPGYPPRPEERQEAMNITTTPWEQVRDESLAAMTEAERAEYDEAAIEAEARLQLEELVYDARTNAGLSQA